MKKVAWITDDIYLQHDTGAGHPESVERLISIHLKIKTLEDKLIEISPRLATKREVNLVHTMELIDDILELLKKWSCIHHCFVICIK